jgi:hypothetical protein
MRTQQAELANKFGRTLMQIASNANKQQRAPVSAPVLLFCALRQLGYSQNVEARGSTWLPAFRSLLTESHESWLLGANAGAAAHVVSEQTFQLLDTPL